MKSFVLIVLFVTLPDFDANNIFKAFFGGPGGFSFEGNFASYMCQTVRNQIVDFSIKLRSHKPLTCLFSASGPGNFFFQFG